MTATEYAELPTPLGATSADLDATRQLRRWATRMRGANLSERTILERLRQVERVTREVDGDALMLTEDDVAGYLAQPHLGNGTRRTYCQALRQWHLFLQQQGIRPDNPMASIRAPKVAVHQPRPIVDAHIERLLACRIKSRTRGMILLGAYAGLRTHEIAKIRTEDCDVNSGQIEILGKGSKTRYVPMHSTVREYLVYKAPSRGWWFPFDAQWPATKPVHAKSVGTAIRFAMDRSGVPGTAHSLRRWFATTLSEQGVAIEVIQGLLGHASLATTQRYLLVRPGRTAEAVTHLPILD